MPLMAIWLGFRPDLREASGTAIFWIKSGYTAGLGLAGIWAVEQLSRPGHRGRGPLNMVLALVTATAIASIVDFALAPAEARQNMLMGSSALLCPFYIMALSVPFFAAGIAFMRRAAPTRLALAAQPWDWRRARSVRGSTPFIARRADCRSWRSGTAWASLRSPPPAPSRAVSCCAGKTRDGQP